MSLSSASRKHWYTHKQRSFGIWTKHPQLWAGRVSARLLLCVTFDADAHGRPVTGVSVPCSSSASSTPVLNGRPGCGTAPGATARLALTAFAPLSMSFVYVTDYGVETHAVLWLYS